MEISGNLRASLAANINMFLGGYGRANNNSNTMDSDSPGRRQQCEGRKINTARSSDSSGRRLPAHGDAAAI